MATTCSLKPREEYEQFEDLWPQLQLLIRKRIQQVYIPNKEWHNSFDKVSCVCLWDSNAKTKLKVALKEEITVHIKELELKVFQNTDDDDDGIPLKSYTHNWGIFIKLCGDFANLFSRLESLMNDSTSNKKQHKGNNIRIFMLHLWKTNIFSFLTSKLQKCAMNLIDKERSGETIESQVVIAVRESFVNLPGNSDDDDDCNYYEMTQYEDQDDILAIYKENFLQPYIEAIIKFYSSITSQYLKSNGIVKYMQFASEKVEEEEVRARKYLNSDSDSDSMPDVMNTCFDVLIIPFKDVVLAECAQMIDRNETENLRIMFRFLDHIPNGVAPMLISLEEYIVKIGLEEMKAEAETIVENPEKFIDQLLILFNRFSLLVSEAFNSDMRFVTSKEKAFKLVLNDTTIFKLELPTKFKSEPESRCPEYLACFCDSLLKKSSMSKKITSEEINEKLSNAMILLKFVHNKDVFVQYYKSHLTRRLLLGTSIDNEKEESTIAALKVVGVPHDCLKVLTKMFQDIKVSEGFNEEFKQLQRRDGKTAADSINVMILEHSAWSRPSAKVSAALPVILEDYISEVELFYKSKHNGRKLQWHNHLSTGFISFANQLGKFDFEVTTMQMAVLFAFNEHPKDRISFENLQLASDLTNSTFRRTLWSLIAFPKIKRQILLCYPEVKSPKDFVSSTEFWINQQFAVMKNGKPAKRGRLNLVGKLLLSNSTNVEEDNEGILKLRELRIQEAIVKIMKMRKKISNAELQAELVRLIKDMFYPTRKVIKDQIEYLIHNEYIMRDEDNFNSFTYCT